MRPARLVLLALLLLALPTSAGARSDVAAAVGPQGLKAFLLRADERPAHEFSRTPSFAWLPVRGAERYEFELSKNASFSEAGIFWSDATLRSPTVSVPVALPWMTGSPYAVYARVRAITRTGVTSWSRAYGFNIRWTTQPTPLPSQPGMSRWSVVEGATSYNVWFPDLRKVVAMRTNAVDHREFYTLHQQPQWSGTVRWRVRAVRSLYGKIPSALPTVTYGPWSQVYTSTNPALAGGVLRPTLTTADTTTSTAQAARQHELTPGFAFAGATSAAGTTYELYRVYVFSDSDCVNLIHRGSIVGSPAYVPRTTRSLLLPTSSLDLVASRSLYLNDLEPGGTEALQRMADAARVTSTESDKAPKAPETPKETPKEGETPPADEDDPASTPPETDPSLPTTPVVSGAPVDLWDSGWPNGRFYWTVVPVQYEVLAPPSTTVLAPVSAGATTARLANITGFSAGALVRVGSGPTLETVTVLGITADPAPALSGTLNVSTLSNAHAQGAAAISLAASLVYWDHELPQDVCASGRRQSFGKGSFPLVATSKSPFVSGLSPKGRLTAAAGARPSFYGPPLIAWRPALGADQYQVQWSKRSYPWVKAGEKLTYATSAQLPLAPGQWYYRVRGINFSLPGTARALSWSRPMSVKVTKPTFTVVGTKQKR